MYSVMVLSLLLTQGLPVITSVIKVYKMHSSQSRDSEIYIFVAHFVRKKSTNAKNPRISMKLRQKTKKKSMKKDAYVLC